MRQSLATLCATLAADLCTCFYAPRAHILIPSEDMRELLGIYAAGDVGVLYETIARGFTGVSLDALPASRAVRDGHPITMHVDDDPQLIPGQAEIFRATGTDTAVVIPSSAVAGTRWRCLATLDFTIRRELSVRDIEAVAEMLDASASRLLGALRREQPADAGEARSA